MSVPAWLQTLRSLRPTHVVTALPRGSGLLLLNPRDLRRAEPAAIARVQVPALFLVPAVLRAARDAGALVGLVKPGALQGEGPTPAQFAAAVVHASEEMGFSQPTWFASAPLPVPDGPAAGEHLRAEIQRYLDAGFTEIALGAPEVLPPGAIEALRTGLSMLREREIPLVLAAAHGAQALALQAELGRAGMGPELVALSRDDESETVNLPLELPWEIARAGLRGVDASGPIASPALRALGERLHPARARELESVDASTVEKLEALTYAEALGILREEPFRGSAQRAMRALAEKPGY